MQIRFPCTACNQTLHADNAAANPWLECPACHLMVPLPGSAWRAKDFEPAANPPAPEQPVLEVDLEELPDQIDTTVSPAGVGKEKAAEDFQPPAPFSVGIMAAPGTFVEEGAFFRVEKPPELPPREHLVVPTEETEEERRQRLRLEYRKGLREEAQSLKTTSLGLKLIYWSTISFLFGILTIVLTVLATVIAAGGGGPGAADSVYVLGVLTSLAFQMFSGLLMLLGKLCCCWVPARSNARTLILVSLALDLASVAQFALAVGLLTFIPVLFTGVARDTALAVGLLVYCLALLLMVASFVLFFLFIRKFGQYLEEPGVAQEAWDIMVTWVWLTVGWPVLILVIVGVGLLNPLILVSLAFFLVLGSFFWLWLYLKQWFRLLNLIASLRQVLATVYGF